ncbi:MAG: PKD domain-containing protein [Bacteroidia bacterium]|nr:PKD domain-containing protein [Bacteroidia bacterium]NNC86494.1 PKD domain-containing protein [Bacteroidia bacterium]NNM15356.1 PKD domain-containing protein [Bacteroidia bacterium]
MKKHILFLFVFTFCGTLFLNAQSTVKERYCHTYEMYEEAVKANPQMIEESRKYEEYLQNYATQNAHRTSATTYVIPVVFHVMHDYGSSNISEAQVLDALSILNEDFQKLNSDTSDIVSGFNTIIGDPDIEFRLAKLDPNGNCTNGITRTYTELTWAANDNVKQLISWPRNKYLNVWVVASLTNAGAGAYAYLPSNSINPTVDGIITRNTQFGSIGMSGSSNLAARTLTHETGHFLSLHHTWGPGNNPGVATNCGQDDYVSDTPNTLGTTGLSCNTGQSTCGNVDNVQNYMDYSSCEKMFTAGQVTRMYAALNSGTAQRNNLPSPANLLATGTNDGYSAPPCIPIADFSPDIIRICTGASVTFQDVSWRGDIANWSWDLPGATPSTSTQQNPTVVYNTAGTYDVTLTVSNASGSDTKVRPGKIIVSNAAAWYSIPFSEGFEGGSFPGWEWHEENGIASTNKWEITNSASASGTYSVKLQNYTNNSGTDLFITPSYNLGAVSSTQMSFKLAYAARSSSGADMLRIQASSDCGRTWQTRYTKTGANLSTAGIYSTNFTPMASEWRQETVNLSSSSVSGKPNVVFKFEFTMDNGNNMYIDDINITGIVGVDETLNDLINLNLMPNPSSDNMNLSFTLNENRDVKATLVDLTGRKIADIIDASLSSGDFNYEILHPGASGMYFIQLEVDNYTSTKKLIFN